MAVGSEIETSLCGRYVRAGPAQVINCDHKEPENFEGSPADVDSADGSLW